MQIYSNIQNSNKNIIYDKEITIFEILKKLKIVSCVQTFNIFNKQQEKNLFNM